MVVSFTVVCPSYAYADFNIMHTVSISCNVNSSSTASLDCLSLVCITILIRCPHFISGPVLPCREMWEYLDHLNTLMQNMGQVMRAMPDSEEAYVRKGLSPSSRSYSISSMSRRCHPRTQSQAIPFVTGEDGELLPGEPIAQPLLLLPFPR